jgi:plastocyanin
LVSGSRALGLAALIALIAVTAGCESAARPEREIVLVAVGMTFALEGQLDAENPVLSLRAGERIRVVLRNEAPGLLHDFAIPDWGVAIDEVRAGESGATTFTVPDTPGRFKYHCRPHSEMMRGVVEVTR